jgi:RNA polymerase sigma-70 factor (ECF subfamily)
MTSARDDAASASTPEPVATIELVRRAQEGERSACEELFSRYGTRVLAIARVRLGARLRGVLESGDILQEALLEGLAGLERFEMRDESSLIRWLARLVEHRITARARHHDVPGRGAAAPDARERASPQPGPATQLVQREDADALHAALAGLPENQREVVLLRDFAGASWEEVARAIEAPTAGAARQLHVRALVRLGARLRER